MSLLPDQLSNLNQLQPLLLPVTGPGLDAEGSLAALTVAAALPGAQMEASKLPSGALVPASLALWMLLLYDPLPGSREQGAP